MSATPTFNIPNTLALILIVALQMCCSTTEAFTIHTSRNVAAQTPRSAMFMNQNHDNYNDMNSLSSAPLLSRKGLFQKLATSSTLVAITTAALSSTTAQPAWAAIDVTSKVASKAALRYMKRAIKEFESLELYATTNDYMEMKQGFRRPGLSEVRKNANVLIKAFTPVGEVDNQDDAATGKQLTAAYSNFIKDLEKLDGEASLGIRGKKNVEMFQSYTKASKDLAIFQEIAESAMAVPADDTPAPTVVESTETPTSPTAAE